MEITTLSTKGQVVIPEPIRRGLDTGVAFSVEKVRDMIILKPVFGLSEIEKKELKELNEIWRDIDSGKSLTLSEDEFFDQMKQW